MNCTSCRKPSFVLRTTKTARVEIRERGCECGDRWETSERETPGTRHRYTAATNSSPVAAPAQPGSNPAPSLSLISDPVSESSPRLSSNPARARVDGRWRARDWLARFALQWVTKYGGLAYGGGDATARACAQLNDIVEALPLADVLAAQARASAMIAEFLGDDSPKVVKARHPFAFFVTAFTGLRVPAKQPGPPVTPQQAEAERKAEWRHQERLAREQLERAEKEALSVQR